MNFEVKTIQVNGDTYSGFSLMTAKDYREQHEKFSDLFKDAPAETKEAFSKSEAFIDPTLTCSAEEIKDAENNFIVFPQVFINKINNDPDGFLDDELVLLVKPSGVFYLSYKDSLSFKFPRDTTNLTKSSLDPKSFIDAFEDKALDNE